MKKPDKGTISIPTSEEPLPLYGEYWVHFHDAAQFAAKELEISIGSAERRLREQCASGDVRSVRYKVHHEQPDESEFLRDPERVKPSEWLKDQLDIAAEAEDDELNQVYAWIDVSEDDVVYWIVEEAVKAGKLSEAPKPAAARGGKVPRIKVHLAELHPNGVREPGLCPRKDLQDTLIKKDKSLAPLDMATLKTAIDEYNQSIRNPKQS
jgi:hypothetical protein